MLKHKIINQKLEELSKSKFRSSFHLRNYMIKYMDDKGMDIILRHAYDFVNDKLLVKKGHPVFISMHACGCCCRGCLEKWHHIPKDKKLTDNEVNYIVCLLMEWIRREYRNNNK